jgi:hypothetical protein
MTPTIPVTKAFRANVFLVAMSSGGESNFISQAQTIIVKLWRVRGKRLSAGSREPPGMSWIEPAPHRVGRIRRVRVEGNLRVGSQRANEIDSTHTPARSCLSTSFFAESPPGANDNKRTKAVLTEEQKTKLVGVTKGWRPMLMDQ